MKNNSLLDKVQVRDDGDRIVLCGEEEAHMLCVAETLEREGAFDVTQPMVVGGKWVTSFRNPRRSACTVTRYDYRLVLTAPSRDLVIPKARELIGQGARLTEGPRQEDGFWKAYLED